MRAHPAAFQVFSSHRLAISLLLAVLATPLRAHAPAFSLAQFSPRGDAGRQALDDQPASDAVIAQVRQQGFYAGRPLADGGCPMCHREIAEQWAASAHRFSSFNNPYYSAAVDLFRQQRDPAATRFCAGCHDPLLLVDDRIAQPNVPRDTVAAQAGLTCLVCHSMQPHTPEAPRSFLLGNAAYRLTLTDVPLPALGADEAPGQSLLAHQQRLRSPALAQPDFCAACHRVGLEPELTHVDWQRGQDDYASWRASLASGQGVAAVYRPESLTIKRCQDCHMPLFSLKSGRQVRSHRFLAANSALPTLRDDPQALAEVQATLRGAVSLDLALVSCQYPTVETPPRFEPQPDWVFAPRLCFDVILRNRRVGHRFPGGTSDSNHVYIEATVSLPGRSGEPILLSDATHLVRAQPVDANGHPIARRDPQNIRGVIYNTSLSPSDPQVVRYVVPIPPEVAQAWSPRAPITVGAVLRYQKFSPAYAAFACQSLPPSPAQTRCLHPPTLDIAEATRTLLPPADRSMPSAPPASLAGSSPTWERFLDHGLGLADGLVDTASDALPSLLRARQLAPARVEPLLGLQRLALALGRTDEVLELGTQAEALRPAHPAHLWLRAQALYRTYRFAEARPFVERLAVLLPGDPAVASLLARVRGLTADPRGALVAAQGLLAIDPESEDGHHQRLLSLRDLGRPPAEVDEAERLYLRHRRPVDREQTLRQLFRQHDPARQTEDILAHTHTLQPVSSPRSPSH